MSFPSSFAGQLAAIMDVLSRAAVAEITTLVEGGSAALRREVSRRDGEILHLRTTLKMMEAELCRAQQTATNRATRDQQEQTIGGKQVSRTDEVDQETGPVYPEPNPAGSVCELHQGTDENIGPEVKEEPADGPVAVETADLEVEDSMWSAPAGHSVSLQVLSSRAAERSADRNTECSFSSSEDCSGVPVKAEPQILSECGERSSQSVHGDPLTQFSHALDNQGAGPSQAPPPAQESAAGTPGSNSEDHVHNRNTWRTKRQVNMWRANQRGFPRLDDNNSSHQPLKPFRCLECGKSFTQKTRLKTHQSVHTGERPFSCSICGKMFSRQDNCLRHERFHSGLKPFSCRQCGRSFTVLGNLRIHQEIHLQGR